MFLFFYYVFPAPSSHLYWVIFLGIDSRCSVANFRYYFILPGVNAPEGSRGSELRLRSGRHCSPSLHDPTSNKTNRFIRLQGCQRNREINFLSLHGPIIIKLLYYWYRHRIREFNYTRVALPTREDSLLLLFLLFLSSFPSAFGGEIESEKGEIGKEKNWVIETTRGDTPLNFLWTSRQWKKEYYSKESICRESNRKRTKVKKDTMKGRKSILL